MQQYHNNRTSLSDTQHEDTQNMEAKRKLNPHTEHKADFDTRKRNNPISSLLSVITETVGGSVQIRLKIFHMEKLRFAPRKSRRSLRTKERRMKSRSEKIKVPKIKPHVKWNCRRFIFSFSRRGKLSVFRRRVKEPSRTGENEFSTSDRSRNTR